VLGQHSTLPAIANSFHGVGERTGQFASSASIPLQQMKGNSLSRFSPDTGHATQTIDQSHQKR
jgi:hypothetical protein